MGGLDHPMVVVTAAGRRAIGGCLFVGFSTQCGLDPPLLLRLPLEGGTTCTRSCGRPAPMVTSSTIASTTSRALFGEHSAYRPQTARAAAQAPSPSTSSPRAVASRAELRSHTAESTRSTCGCWAVLVSRHDAGDHVAFVLDPVRTHARRPAPARLPGRARPPRCNGQALGVTRRAAAPWWGEQGSVEPSVLQILLLPPSSRTPLTEYVDRG